MTALARYAAAAPAYNPWRWAGAAESHLASDSDTAPIALSGNMASASAVAGMRRETRIRSNPSKTSQKTASSDCVSASVAVPVDFSTAVP